MICFSIIIIYDKTGFVNRGPRAHFAGPRLYKCKNFLDNISRYVNVLCFFVQSCTLSCIPLIYLFP